MACLILFKSCIAKISLVTGFPFALVFPTLPQCVLPSASCQTISGRLPDLCPPGVSNNFSFSYPPPYIIVPPSDIISSAQDLII
ncbi:hypothetical protein FcAc13_06030 [Frischella sp. Ac13]|uniref:Secreted protein n=1 Tax=Frischella japonica TaxID=2741544 RepID=A0ABR7QXB5_9GAMM|nr:hypothetical protein [Frischella japonica]MBC9130866.1 hypothetical protein [Frischella japonica]